MRGVLVPSAKHSAWHFNSSQHLRAAQNRLPISLFESSCFEAESQLLHNSSLVGTARSGATRSVQGDKTAGIPLAVELPPPSVPCVQKALSALHRVIIFPRKIKIPQSPKLGAELRGLRVMHRVMPRPPFPSHSV